MELSFANLPLGETPVPSSSDSTEEHFTGKERDSESGLDNFGARYFGSNMGRFMSPDPSGLSYADPTNPQSLNLYSYVLNNPLVYTDPSGLSCQGDHDEVQSDDGDGKGCVAAGINPDGSEITKTIQATVNADGHVDLDEYYRDQGIMQHNNYLMSQQPAQLSPTGRQLLNLFAQDTAGFPAVCSVGLTGQVGYGNQAVGGSYDTSKGFQGNVRDSPAGVGPVNVNVSMNSKGQFSGGVVLRDPASGIGGGVSVSQSGVATASVSEQKAVGVPFTNLKAAATVGATATLGTIGDPRCQPHP